MASDSDYGWGARRIAFGVEFDPVSVERAAHAIGRAIRDVYTGSLARPGYEYAFMAIVLAEATAACCSAAEAEGGLLGRAPEVFFSEHHALAAARIAAVMGKEAN